MNTYNNSNMSINNIINTKNILLILSSLFFGIIQTMIIYCIINIINKGLDESKLKVMVFLILWYFFGLYSTIFYLIFGYIAYIVFYSNTCYKNIMELSNPNNINNLDLNKFSNIGFVYCKLCVYKIKSSVFAKFSYDFYSVCTIKLSNLFYYTDNFIFNKTKKLGNYLGSYLSPKQSAVKLSSDLNSNRSSNRNIDPTVTTTIPTMKEINDVYKVHENIPIKSPELPILPNFPNLQDLNKLHDTIKFPTIEEMEKQYEQTCNDIREKMLQMDKKKLYDTIIDDNDTK